MSISKDDVTSGSPGDIWTRLVNMVIRPPRAIYEAKHLGPSTFFLHGKHYIRSDLELENKRGLKIQASHFMPSPKLDIDGNSIREPIPCVVYCHGNAGSRLMANSIIDLLLPYRISVFAFDFTGSGLSEGEYVSLGHYESQDLSVAVNYLRESGTTTTIALWGRSMGAVSCLLYAAEDPSIACMILDSPFADLRMLIEELVARYSSKIPSFMIKLAIGVLRKSIQSRAEFDVDEVSPVNKAASCFVPVILAHATHDELICVKHSDLISKAYAGDKQIKILDEDDQGHNSIRPNYFYHGCTIFLISCLNPSQLDNAKGVPVSPVKPTGNFRINPEIVDFSIPNNNDAEDDEELFRAIMLSLQEMDVSINNNPNTNV